MLVHALVRLPAMLALPAKGFEAGQYEILKMGSNQQIMKSAKQRRVLDADWCSWAIPAENLPAGRSW